jgi:plastocyanin
MHARRRSVATLTLAVSLAVGLIGPAVATSEVVEISGTSFSPKTVSSLPPGGVVTWEYAGGDLSHNVKQNKGLFRSGDPTDGVIDFSRTFSAGTFPYKCEVHASSGMTGKVKIPVSASVNEADLYVVEWAVDGSNTGGKFDVQYKVGDGNWKNWLQNTTKLKKVFGKDGSPVAYDDSKTYSLRARSQKGTDADGKVSGWSPPLSIGFMP